MSRIAVNRIASPAIRVLVAALALSGAPDARQAASQNPAVSTRAADDRFDPLLELAKRELEETRTPGAAIALVDGDRVVFTAGVGAADAETSAPMRPEMLVRLGSTTKMFTAAALVMLAEEGRLELDAPIGAVVSGLHADVARLTPHQLLSHTAGLRDEAPMFGRHDDDALGAGIRAMNARAFFTEPSDVYSYSNPGYWISGFLVEHIVGKPFADAMTDRLFAPLGMTRTTFRPTLAMTYPLAQGHESAGGKPAVVIRPAANNVATWPAGSMFSNVHNLSRFVIAFMNKGQIDGRQVMLPSVITKMSSPQAPIPGGSESYGYGLNIAERGGVTVVSHGGSRAGYGSTVMMVPSRRVAAITLGNRTGSGLPRTARRGVEMLLNMPEGGLSPARSSDTAAVDRESLAAWAGRYSQGAGTPIEIAMKGDSLVVRSGAEEMPAKPQGTARLLVGSGENATTLVLVRDKKGNPAYVFRGGRAFRRLP